MARAGVAPGLRPHLVDDGQTLESERGVCRADRRSQRDRDNRQRQRPDRADADRAAGGAAQWVPEAETRLNAIIVRFNALGGSVGDQREERGD